MKLKVALEINTRLMNNFINYITLEKENLISHTGVFFKTLLMFRQRGRKGERERKKINVWLPLLHPPLGT